MKYAEKEVLQFVAENDVKFIRLMFCDILGTLKSISIMSNELENAFENGVSFDSYIIKGFADENESELLLFPDSSTLSVLPWRPQQGRVARLYCSVCHMDRTPYECDSRSILQKVVEIARKKGYSFTIGTESEFYLFETDDMGYPTKKPHDDGGYCDVAPLDLGENVRREVCLMLEQMGIVPKTSHHEKGPGQNEIVFNSSSPLEAADNMLTFKSVVKNVASLNGLYASFMPKPISGRPGSGLNVKLSMFKENDMYREKASEAEVNAFAAGVLKHSREITLFFNSTTNSYRRLGKGETSRFVSWSESNRTQLMMLTNNTSKNEMKLRSPDAAINPYLAFALLIGAGLNGIEKSFELPEASNVNLAALSADKLAGIPILPETLGDAILLAKESELVRSIGTPKAIEKFIAEKSAEWREYQDAEDRDVFENNHYFTRL